MLKRTLKYFAEQAYKLDLMRGISASNYTTTDGTKLLCNVSFDDGCVMISKQNHTGEFIHFHNEPIRKAWMRF